MVVSDNVASPTQSLTYAFNYGYLVAPNNPANNTLPTGYTEANDIGTTHKKRLKLNSVIMPDNNLYSFTYYGDGSSDMRTRLTYGVDNWGFANGAEGNINSTGLIGKNVLCSSGSNRETNANYSLFSTLIKINSTMGSETSFDFETHRANNYGNGNTDIGGFRIKKIHNKDLLRNTETVKEYSYLLGNGQSSGFLFIQPTYQFTSNIDGNIYYSNSSLYAYMQSEAGKPTVGYKQVTETVYDSGNTMPLGKTISYFDQDETELSLAKSGVCYDIISGTFVDCTIYQPESFNPQHDFRSGSLIKMEHYNQSNQLLSSNEMSYTPNNGIKFDSIYCKKVIKFNGLNQSDYYYVVLNKYRIKQTVSKAFSQDGSGTPQINTVDFTYKDEMPAPYRTTYKGKHNQVVKTSTTDSYGYLVESFNKYAADFNFDKDSVDVCETDCVQGCSNPNCHYWLVTAHVPPTSTAAYGVYSLGLNMLATPIETFSQRNGKVISASYQSFFLTNVATGINFTLPKDAYLLRTLPTTNFNELVYNRSLDNMVKDTQYGAARNSILAYNTLGYPTQSKQTYGSTNQMLYDTSNLLPISQTQNWGIADALLTSYEFTQKFQGLSKTIAPNTLEMRYNYRILDSRLQSILDKDGKILKKFDYNQTPSN